MEISPSTDSKNQQRGAQVLASGKANNIAKTANSVDETKAVARGKKSFLCAAVFTKLFVIRVGAAIRARPYRNGRLIGVYIHIYVCAWREPGEIQRDFCEEQKKKKKKSRRSFSTSRRCKSVTQ